MMAYSRGSSASPIVFDVLLIRIARDVDNLRCSIRRRRTGMLKRITTLRIH
jgi:hypothetical protein